MYRTHTHTHTHTHEYRDMPGQAEELVHRIKADSVSQSVGHI